MKDLILDEPLIDSDGRAVKFHGPADFEGMRRAGRLAAETLDYIVPFVKPGITTGELDRLCHDFIVAGGAIPAPLGYKGFPKSICTSVNHVVCHGIPGDKVLEDGDILNLDVTTILDGWHGDTSRMCWASRPSGRAPRWATSGTPSRSTPKRSASPSCAISAATGSAACSMTPRRCFTMARRATA
jgi:methionine aminopeptidase type I